MKPDTHSRYFKYSMLCLAAFFIHLFILGRLVKHYTLSNDSSAHGYSAILLFAPLIWIGLGGLFNYKATALKQTATRQVLAFVLAPFALIFFEIICYVLIVLLPLYGVVSNKGF
jgi:hypothetical protein